MGGETDVKRKKRYPRVMVTLLLLLAIVIIILLFRHIAGIETINTKLFKTNPAAAVQQAAPETPALDEIPAAEEQTPAQTEIPVQEEQAPAAEEQAAVPASSGTVVDTGIIRTVCPDGWMNIQLTDVFGEKDENGNYPPDTTRIGLCKGGTSQVDALTNLTVYVYYASGEYSDNTIANSAMWYSDTEDIAVTINGVEYKGFHAREESLFTEGQYYEYDNLYMPADESHNIQIQVMNSAPDVEGTLSLDDPDVQAIISNIALD